MDERRSSLRLMSLALYNREVDMITVMEELGPETREQLCRNIEDAGDCTPNELLQLILPYFASKEYQEAQLNLAALREKFQDELRLEEGDPFQVLTELEMARKLATQLPARETEAVAAAKEFIATLGASGLLVPAERKSDIENLRVRAVDGFTI